MNRSNKLHDADRTLTVVEVKQILRDIAFVLQMTRRVRTDMGIVTPSGHLAANASENPSTPAYAL